MELAASGKKETPLQKYYRLKFETEELEQEISSLKVCLSCYMLYIIIYGFVKAIFLINYFA